jgi:hypothetical protein
MTKSKIKKWMYENYTDYLDDIDCLNTTVMAECCYDHLEHEIEVEVPEIYFETAIDIEIELQKKNIINI